MRGTSNTRSQTAAGNRRREAVKERMALGDFRRRRVDHARHIEHAGLKLPPAIPEVKRSRTDGGDGCGGCGSGKCRYYARTRLGRHKSGVNLWVFIACPRIGTRRRRGTKPLAQWNTVEGRLRDEATSWPGQKRLIWPELAVRAVQPSADMLPAREASARLCRWISHDGRSGIPKLCADHDIGGDEMPQQRSWSCRAPDAEEHGGRGLHMNTALMECKSVACPKSETAPVMRGFQAEVRSAVRSRERKRLTGRGPALITCGGEKGSSACGRISESWRGSGASLRSSRIQRAKKASAVTSIHCSSNAVISLRRLAAWFRRESSKLSSEVSDASCK